MFFVAQSAFAILLLATGAAHAFTPWGTNLAGQPVEQLAPSHSPAVVLFFAATDCPLSNRYTEEIQDLATAFEPQGVRVWFVYPNPSDTAAVIRAHEQRFGKSAHTLLDSRHALTALTHASVTPEAAILVPTPSGLRPVYVGRIDDRYMAFGKERPQATHHDLEAALRAVLAHKPVPSPGGEPVGCSILGTDR